MSLKKAIISTAAVAAIVSSASGAVSLESKGNYIVMPAYYALENGNWSTDLRVVNTNTTDATVAKVVIRSYKNSEELLDFPIYLSPGDVWSAKIVNVDGVPTLKSTDDSMIIGTPKKVVSEANPVSQPLHIANCGGGTCGDYGYVEVFALGQAAGVDINSSFQVGNPLPKMDIFNSFFYPKDSSGDNVVLANRTREVGVWDIPDDNSLYAQSKVEADGTGAEKSMTLMSTASTGVVTELSAATYGTLIGTDSLFKNMYSSGMQTSALAELNTSLAKTDVYVTYYNNEEKQTKLILTQPLKHYENNETGGAAYYDASNWTYLSITVRDLMEHTHHVDTNDTDFSGGPEGPKPTNTPCKTEQCYLNTSVFNAEGYAEGYVDFGLLGADSNNSNANAVHQLPAIPTVVSGVMVGSQPVVNAYKPAFENAPN